MDFGSWLSVEQVVLVLTVLVALQFLRQWQLTNQLARLSAANEALQKRVVVTATTDQSNCASTHSPSSRQESAKGQSKDLVQKRVNASENEPHQRLRSDSRSLHEEEPLPNGGTVRHTKAAPADCSQFGAQQERRWICVGEVTESELSDPNRRQQAWNGCGVGPAELLRGQLVAVDGSPGLGRVTGFRTSRWGAARNVFSIADAATSRVEEYRLALEGSGTDFQIQDVRDVRQPWRWSFDDRWRPSPPPPGWGFAGNLDSDQQESLREFAVALRQDVDMAAATELAEEAALQFLRATGFKVAAAVRLYLKGTRWREEFGLEKLMTSCLTRPPRVIGDVGGDGQRRLQALYPHLMAGYDRNGRPVRVECMGRIRTKLLYEFTDEEALMRYHVYQNEETARRFLPAANRRVGSNHREITAVLDMTHAKVGEMMSSDSRRHIANFLNLQDYFPELLGKMLIVNAPKVLSMMWDFVSPMLDERTKSKIVICPPGARSLCALQSEIHPSQLPRFLGGQLPTPLDELLSRPRVNSHAELEAALDTMGDWDGYWGLSTPPPPGVPVHAAEDCADGAGEARQRPMLAAAMDATVVSEADESRLESQATFVIADPCLPDCPVTHASQGFCTLTGYSREEVVGQNCRFLQGPDTDQKTLCAIRDALAARVEITVKLLNYKKDGTRFWNLLRVIPVHVQGQPLRFLGCQVDITADVLHAGGAARSQGPISKFADTGDDQVVGGLWRAQADLANTVASLLNEDQLWSEVAARDHSCSASEGSLDSNSSSEDLNAANGCKEFSSRSFSRSRSAPSLVSRWQVAQETESTREASAWLVSRYNCDDRVVDRVLDALRNAHYPENTWADELQEMHRDGSIKEFLAAATKMRASIHDFPGPQTRNSLVATSEPRVTSKGKNRKRSKNRRKELQAEKAALTEVIAAELRTLGLHQN